MNTIFDIQLENDNKKDVLEKIQKFINNPQDILHIVSINPEILIETFKNNDFKKAVTTAQIKIIDGSGILAAARMKGIQVGERFTGVSLMEELLKLGNNQSLRIMLLGGNAKIANIIIDCQRQAHSKAQFTSLIGIEDIRHPTQKEEDEIRSIVTDFKPQILLVSFGSPFQELWIYNHREMLENVVCAGVGGAFNFVAGVVPRAPKIIQQIGLEYLYRLIIEPWRWKRQLNVVYFGLLSLIEAIRYRLIKK